MEEEKQVSQVFHANVLLRQGAKEWLRSLGGLLESFVTEEVGLSRFVYKQLLLRVLV